MFQQKLCAELVSLKTEFESLKQEVTEGYDRANAPLDSALEEHQELNDRVLAIHKEIASHMEIDLKVGANPSD